MTIQATECFENIRRLQQWFQVHVYGRFWNPKDSWEFIRGADDGGQAYVLPDFDTHRSYFASRLRKSPEPTTKHTVRLFKSSNSTGPGANKQVHRPGGPAQKCKTQVAKTNGFSWKSLRAQNLVNYAINSLEFVKFVKSQPSSVLRHLRRKWPSP